MKRGENYIRRKTFHLYKKGLKVKVTPVESYKEKSDTLQVQLKAVTKANEVIDIREKVTF